MGNGKSKSTKSVDRTSASSIVVDWKNDSYINHLIVAGRLAPKSTDNTENREAECPICFLNFEFLNTVVCCKQAICTGCVVQLKRASTAAACPFCSEKTMAVSFSRSRRISEPGAPPAVYTTPEQDRKLRSMSSDEIHVAPVSKQTREELEREISTQRMMYHDPDEDNRVLAQASVRRPRAVTTSSLRNRNTYDFNSNSRSTSSRMNQRHSNYQSSSPGRPPAGDGLGGESGMLSTLRTILGPSQLDQINSIEELEELMLLEAIRQSQNEASSATTASSTLTPVAPSVPSPSHPSPSSRRHRKSHHNSRSQQLLGDFRDSQMSNSVSSSGSNRLDSGSEGNKSNSQLSELEVNAAMNAVDTRSSSNGVAESSSSSSSSTGSGATGSSTISQPTAAAVMASMEEEEDELYDEELELALQLSLMNAHAKLPATVVPPAHSSSSSSVVANSAVEEENSKLSGETHSERPASASETVVESTDGSGLLSTPPKALDAVQAYNNNWLNAFETDLSMGMMIKASEEQPASDGRHSHHEAITVGGPTASQGSGGSSSSSSI